MTIARGQFERIAEAVTERAAELLCAHVSVLDTHGQIIATSGPDRAGPTLKPSPQPLPEEAYLRIPVHLDTGAGEVVVTQPANGEMISPRLGRVLVELMINQTTMVDRLPNKLELKDKLIHDLLYGPIGDEARILREAQILGMNLAFPRAVVLIDAAEYILASRAGQEPSQVSMRRRAQLVIGSIVDFFELPNDTICAYIGNGEVAVLKASNKQSLASWVERNDDRDLSSQSWTHLAALKRAGIALLTRLHSDTGATITIGIGRYHPGLQGLAHSHQDARAALSLGRRFHGQNAVHCLDELGIAGFVGIADEHTKVDLAVHLLSPLDHEPELLATLDAYFSCDCCPSETANRLSVHRNTLSYRLDKIASLTGLNPRRFDDAVQIRLALLLRSLHGDGELMRSQTTQGLG